ncbi:hypothetical protein Ddc_08431 [Ditylenchus destructor]|nr:hypothetical protein Ddc_08431 [Ditylenchus destructor]
MRQLFSSVTQTIIFVLILAVFIGCRVDAVQICPASPTSVELTCSVACCKNLNGPDQDYYCCGDDNQLNGDQNSDKDVHRTRAERYAAYQTAFQVDYTLLVIGLIISIIVSILLSFLCCLLCNGCWLHRRRNPERYETVNDSGFYPICCGFGIPLGTVVFSTHPPQFNNDGIYGGSSNTSLPSSRNRVRFNEDGSPMPMKGVLKNGNGAPEHHFG